VVFAGTAYLKILLSTVSSEVVEATLLWVLNDQPTGKGCA